MLRRRQVGYPAFLSDGLLPQLWILVNPYNQWFQRILYTLALHHRQFFNILDVLFYRLKYRLKLWINFVVGNDPIQIFASPLLHNDRVVIYNSSITATIVIFGLSIVYWVVPLNSRQGRNSVERIFLIFTLIVCTLCLFIDLWLIRGLFLLFRRYTPQLLNGSVLIPRNLHWQIYNTALWRYFIRAIFNTIVVNRIPLRFFEPVHRYCFNLRLLLLIYIRWLFFNQID
jgi:hypothetical protein